MIEEDAPEPEVRDGMEEVPPSSDRNQRAADMQMGTEDKMWWFSELQYNYILLYCLIMCKKRSFYINRPSLDGKVQPTRRKSFNPSTSKLEDRELHNQSANSNRLMRSLKSKTNNFDKSELKK